MKKFKITKIKKKVKIKKAKMPNKMHKMIIKEGKPFYLCNQAVRISKDKCTILWRRVTCRNCLKKEIEIWKNKKNDESKPRKKN